MRSHPQVEDFIMASGIDEDAANMLRGAPFNVQKEVIVSDKTGGVRDLDGVDNPSKCVIGRIKKARAKQSGGGGGGMNPMMQQMMRMNPMMAMQMQAMGMGGMMGGKGGGKGGGVQKPAFIKNGNPNGQKFPGVQAFIMNYGIDEDASNALLNSSVAVQREVIVSDKTGGVRDLDGVNNPSKCVMARIQKAQQKHAGGGMGMNPMMGMMGMF